MWIIDVTTCLLLYYYFFFFKQKTAYEMRISDWSSDVCSSDLDATTRHQLRRPVQCPARPHRDPVGRAIQVVPGRQRRLRTALPSLYRAQSRPRATDRRSGNISLVQLPGVPGPAPDFRPLRTPGLARPERKSVWYGTRVSGSVE